MKHYVLPLLLGRLEVVTRSLARYEVPVIKSQMSYTEAIDGAKHLQQCKQELEEAIKKLSLIGALKDLAATAPKEQWSDSDGRSVEVRHNEADDVYTVTVPKAVAPRRSMMEAIIDKYELTESTHTIGISKEKGIPVYYYSASIYIAECSCVGYPRTDGHVIISDRASGGWHYALKAHLLQMTRDEFDNMLKSKGYV